MIAVIQCAARKSDNAGSLRSSDGRRVMFVARPLEAPASMDMIYAHPDHPSDQDGTWRDVLLAYNNDPAGNPLGLLPAIMLYSNPAYIRLAAAVPADRLFILSAGWGLIPAGFLTPVYDITFSGSADGWKRRRRTDNYDDLRLLPAIDEDIVFFGGKDYLPLFCDLTKDASGNRTVIYNAIVPPQASGCKLVRFDTPARTNWHYEAVKAWLAGKLAL